MERAPKPTVVDIFCGAGGLSEGFRQAGYRIILGIDSDEWAITTYRQRHGKAYKKNVEKIDAAYIFRTAGSDRVDVLVGGPPCQAFSSIAVAKWREVGTPSTMDHPMNQLYAEFLRIVREVKPKLFVIENVERMLSIDEGALKKDVEMQVKNAYNISFYKFDVADFGVPQHRKRAIVIGNMIGSPNPVIETTHSDRDPTKKPHVTVRQAISDLPILKAGEGKTRTKYPYRKQLSEYATERRNGSQFVYDHIARSHNERDLKIFRMLKPGQWIRDLPARYNPYRKDVFLDRYKKQFNNRPSSTILAHLSKDGLMFIHPDRKQNRSFTPREAARLQSLDDTYIFKGPRTKQYIQIGNAVPPLFAKSIALAIKELLQVKLPVSR